MGGDPPPTVAGILASVAGSTFVVGDIGAIVKNGYRLAFDRSKFSLVDTGLAAVGIWTTTVPGGDQAVGILRAVSAAARKGAVSEIIGAFVQAGFKNAKDTAGLVKHVGNLVKLAKGIIQSDESLEVPIKVVTDTHVFRSLFQFIKNVADDVRQVIWSRLKLLMQGSDGVRQVQQLLELLSQPAPSSSRTFDVSINNFANAAAGVTTVTNTVFSESTTALVKVSSVQVPESAGFAQILVELVGPSAAPVSVYWTTVDGSATSIDSDDFTDSNGMVLLDSTSASGQMVAIPIRQNNVPESSESFHLYFYSGEGVEFLNQSASVTIIDDDSPITVIIADVTVDETDDEAELTLTLSTSLDDDITIHWRPRGGSAAPGTDFDGASQEVFIASGTTTATLIVPLIDDDREDGERTFSIALDEPSWFAALASSPTVAIQDDEPRPKISIHDAFAEENDLGIDFEIELTNYVGLTSAIVDWRVVLFDSNQLPAASSGDFDLDSFFQEAADQGSPLFRDSHDSAPFEGSVLVAGGLSNGISGNATIRIPLLPDLRIEGVEYFSIEISLSSGVASSTPVDIDQATALGVIFDSTPRPRVAAIPRLTDDPTDLSVRPENLPLAPYFGYWNLPELYWMEPDGDWARAGHDAFYPRMVSYHVEGIYHSAPQAISIGDYFSFASGPYPWIAPTVYFRSFYEQRYFAEPRYWYNAYGSYGWYGNSYGWGDPPTFNPGQNGSSVLYDVYLSHPTSQWVTISWESLDHAYSGSVDVPPYELYTTIEIPVVWSADPFASHVLFSATNADMTTLATKRLALASISPSSVSISTSTDVVSFDSGNDEPVLVTGTVNFSALSSLPWRDGEHSSLFRIAIYGTSDTQFYRTWTSVPQSPDNLIGNFQFVLDPRYTFDGEIKVIAYWAYVPVGNATVAVAFNAKPNLPTANIVGDVDHNGYTDFPNGSRPVKDDTNEETTGIFVVADKDNVYSAASDAAIRQRIDIFYDASEPLVLRRSRKSGKASDIKLFAQPTLGGELGGELFGNGNEIKLPANQTHMTFFVQGGDISENAEGDRLTVVDPRRNKTLDSLKVTSIWVNLRAYDSPSIKLPPNTVMGSASTIRRTTGITHLGVQQMHGTQHGRNAIGAAILIAGEVLPQGVKLRDITGLTTQETPRGGDLPRIRLTTTEFGFVMKRYLDSGLVVKNGIPKGQADIPAPGFDDSQKDVQDTTPQAWTDPNHVEGNFIFDFDSPTAGVLIRQNQEADIYTQHTRFNYTQSVQFNRPGVNNHIITQRVSERLKWSVTLDVAAVLPQGTANTNAKATVAIDKANNGAGANEITINEGVIDTTALHLPAPAVAKVETTSWNLFPGELTEPIILKGAGTLVGVPYLISNNVILAPRYYVQKDLNTIEVRFAIPQGALVGWSAKLIMKTNSNDKFEYTDHLFVVTRR